MMTSVEDRFNAAVNVIKGLPKNGSYQPSNDMMLRFYSYYKQATIGPCKQKKPPFWDIVSKAKWDSWMCLGQLPREKAMENYVDELKKIIETMSYTDNVANFMGSINELDGVNVDDLEAVAPEIIKKARSQPNSPFASREASPTRAPISQNGYLNGGPESNHIHQNGYSVDQSDDEYIDTVEDNVDIPTFRKSRSNNISTRSDINYEISRDGAYSALQQILQTVQRMNTDIQSVTLRIHSLEKNLLELRTSQANQQLTRSKYPNWWPFTDISPKWFIFMIMWPFLAQRFAKMLQKKK